jgi:formylmethanofuran dehydrogenase subunit E
MKEKRITLKEGIKFHGHLGPYLVLGIRAGELALKKLKFKRYFGVGVKVWGAAHKPKSCLIDGLQLSTGATLGKGNIEKFNGPAIKIEFMDKEKGASVSLSLRQGLLRDLAEAKTHESCERLAKKLYSSDFTELFSADSD